MVFSRQHATDAAGATRPPARGDAVIAVLRCTDCVTRQEAHRERTTFTFRVDPALKAAFSAAAKSRDRNAAQLLRDFVRQQQQAADHDAWFRRQVQAGLDSAQAGRLIPAAEVEAQFSARRAATRRRLEAAAE